MWVVRARGRSSSGDITYLRAVIEPAWTADVIVEVGPLVIDGQVVALLFDSCAVAQRTVMRLSAPSDWAPIDVDRAILWERARAGQV